jgi:hypothetical protein
MRDYYGQTTIHPLGLVAVLVLGTAMLLLPRRYASLPMIVMACFIAPAQRIVVLGADFNLLRIMVLFGFVRLLMRKEFHGVMMRPMDWLVIGWATANTASYTILHMSAAALVNRLGFSFDAIGMYFLFRCLTRSWQDVDRVVLGFIVVSVPVAIYFLIERSTGRNLFAVFGGVPAMTLMREGRLRCQGPFPHAILAGCFWASVLPLVGAWWWRGQGAKVFAGVGVACCVVIIITCASSTPVVAVLFGALGWSVYRCRSILRRLRWSLLSLILVLHLLMAKPVWHLIARINVVGGSTGHHRYKLIDGAVNHVAEWWLFGTESTAHWGRGLSDVTNQYVLEGVRGGLLTLLLFVALIVLAFKHIGCLHRTSEAAGQHYARMLAWGLGVALFVHVTTFFGVSYFGQMIMVWYMTLGMIGGVGQQLRTKAALSVARRRVLARALLPLHGQPIGAM